MAGGERVIALVVEIPMWQVFPDRRMLEMDCTGRNWLTTFLYDALVLLGLC